MTAGIYASDSDFVVVMDGDLQHPSEMIPELRDAADGVDLSMASRYGGDGGSSGMSSSYRRWVSGGGTVIAQACSLAGAAPASGSCAKWRACG